MAHRPKTSGHKRQRRRRSYARHRRSKPETRSGLVVKRRNFRISDARLERGLRVLTATNDVTTASRAIRVSPEKFKRAAKRKGAIRKRNGRWTVVAALPRRIPIFTGGKQIAITVRSRTASLIGRYMSAVRHFLRTNNATVLAEFKGRVVKDKLGKSYLLETDPNVLYRLSSAGGEPFKSVYRIVL